MIQRGRVALLLLVVIKPPAPHPIRTRILEHLHRLPGDHLRSIARTLHVSLGDVRYHLHVLRRSGLVREERVRHRLRYYALDPGHLAERNVLFQHLWEQHDTRAQVLYAVRTHGTVKPTQVAKTMGISRQLASYHLGHLADSGQLSHEGTGYRLHTDQGDLDPSGESASFPRDFLP